MRSQAQHERQQRLEMSARRAKELAMLQLSAKTADHRYVQDAAGWIWRGVLERKLKAKDRLPLAEQRRLRTLVVLESARLIDGQSYFGV